MSKELLWVEKYRPKKVADTILPKELKTTFQTFVDQRNVPNLLLTGTAGVGKTTIARAMLDEIGYDVMVINGSLHGNIDTLRTQIQTYASTVSFTGDRKFVILDEADYLNPQSTQPALRNFMEEFSKNCGFILTCNFKNRIIEPLHSRCSVVDFKIPNPEKPKLAAQFLKRLTSILENEGVEFETKVVAELITKHFPDWRRIINECQRHAAIGKISSEILVNLSDENFDKLINYMKERNFKAVRKWVGENSDIETTVLYRTLYDRAYNYVEPRSIPQLVLHIAEYSYKDAFVADHEINLVACLVEIMADCEWT